MAQATATTRAFGASVLTSAEKNKAAFTTLGFAALGLGAGIGFAMKSAADAAIEFESAFAGVRKTVDASEEEFAVIEQGIRDMAKTMPIGTTELARIAEAAGQLGVKTENILSFTRTMADLGVTTNLASDEAATALARLANITQMPQSEFQNLGSSVVDLGNKFATTEAEIVEMGLRIAGAGQQIGLTEAEILGFAAALSSVGIEAQMGGTAISRVFVQMANDVAQGGDKLETFAEVAGMSGEEFRRAFQTDAAGAIVAFVEGLKRISDSGENVFAVLQELGFGEVRVRDALLRTSGASDLLSTALDTSSTAWQENNALTVEAEKRYDTTASKIQIAKNRINDAAISFGQILLPAIAAVVGVFGDVADAINMLPGPVKAVILALAGIVAAMALVAGGTLILIPRLAAVSAAFGDIGLKAGLVKGSMTLLRGAFSPLSLAVTAVTVGLGIFAQKAAESRAHVEEMTAAVEADSGALGTNTRALVVNRLEREGLLEDAQRLGLGLETVADAAMGNAGAMGQVDAAIAAVADRLHVASDELIQVNWDDSAEAALNLQNGLGNLREEVDAGAEAAVRKARAIGDDAEATDGAVGPTEKLGGATGDLAGELEEAAEAADIFADALEALAGVQITTEKASLDWRDAVLEMGKELRKGTKTLDVNSAAGRENRRAILSAVDAALEHGQAVVEETGSIEKGARVVRNHVRELVAEAREAGISEKAIRDYIQQLNLTPDQIRTLIQLNTEQASNQMQTFVNRWAGTTISVRAHVSGLPGPHGGVQHGGGMVGAPRVRRLHSGGNLRGDEGFFIGQRGERVLSASEWRTLRSITGAGAQPVRTAPRVHPRGDVNVAVRLGRRRFTEELEYDTAYDGRWS